MFHPPEYRVCTKIPAIAPVGLYADLDFAVWKPAIRGVVNKQSGYTYTCRLHLFVVVSNCKQGYKEVSDTSWLLFIPVLEEFDCVYMEVNDTLLNVCNIYSTGQ